MESCSPLSQFFPRPSCKTALAGTVIISLIVFGILAHQQIGQLAQMGNAAGFYAGIGCWTTSGLIVLGIALMKARNLCHKNRRGVAQTFEDFTPGATRKSKSLTPTEVKQQIVKKLGFKKTRLSEEAKRVAKWQEGRFSYNGLSAEDKSRIQTACAIEEGKQDTKLAPRAKFVVTDKSEKQAIEEQENFGVAHDQGYRDSDEDEYSVEILEIQRGEETIKAHLFGVYDGHSGKKAATSVKENIALKLKEKLEAANDLDHETICDALTLTMIELETEFLEQKQNDGTCLTCALRIGDKIYLPNVGDSRILLVKPNISYQLTEDDENRIVFLRKTDGNPRFLKNTKKPAHYRDSQMQHNGNYAITRDIGVDNLSCRPKIGYIQLSDQEDDPKNGRIYYQEDANQYLIMGCDGLWDVATNGEVAEAVRRLHEVGATCGEIAQTLVDAANNAVYFEDRGYCQFRHGGDNLTVIAIKL